jgi:hypothetical protein
MKRIAYIWMMLLISQSIWAQDRKFQVNGDARGYMFAKNMLIDQELDSINSPRANYGHTLVDLGFSIFPNDNTEIISSFRIRNELGGFWGGGVSFDVRQLTLNGVAANTVKYNLGDIDIKMTPYTLYNFEEEGMINEAEIFALRREIVHYDMFYMPDNTWRMQGAQVGFGLEFNKLLKAIEFSGFITRQRPTDGIAVPERAFGGGTMTWKQNDHLQFAYNSVNLFDLTRTISDSMRYRNNIHTFSTQYRHSLSKKIDGGFDGEAGFSNVNYLNYTNPLAPAVQDDWFYDASVMLHFKEPNIHVTLGYKDVGADFFSPGAQTKRVNFNRFPGVFEQYTNDALGRPINLTDIINHNAGYTFQISERLMAYNAAYDNINPHGIATPNRRGMYLNSERCDSTKFKRSFIQIAQLFESRGMGTNLKKSFTSIGAGTDIAIHDFFGWKRELMLNLGIRHDITQRGGEVFEKINLSSTLVDLGLSIRLVDKLDLLLGAKYFQANGNEFITQRNVFNTVNNFQAIDINLNETTLAGGLRYKFSEGNNLLINYQHHQLTNKTTGGIDYGISQFNILYTLTF